MKVGYWPERDEKEQLPETRAANEWQREALKIRPLQPFEDYYKAIRAFEAGAEWARNQKQVLKS